MPTPINFRKQLQFYLEKKDLTLSRLARKVGISKSTISGWLGGSMPRDLSQVKIVAEILGTSVDHLVFGNGSDEIQGMAVRSDLFPLDQWTSGTFEIKIKRIKA